jgi:predicted ATP-dependent endonuclease of OLD family
MRIKSVYISDYKNLKDFTLNFDGTGFIDVFVGKNGTGKSNLFEALIEIFQHLNEFDKDRPGILFDYIIKYEIDNNENEIKWSYATEKLIVNGVTRKSIGTTPFPNNVLIYYSGHNNMVTDLVNRYEESFKRAIKRADNEDTRKFIGIGSDYKQLLLSVLLVQKQENKARKFICRNLGIRSVAPEVKLVLKRPYYANSTDFNIVNNDETDRYWKPDGITKRFLDRLTKCARDDSKGPVRTEGYLANLQQYILYLDIEKISREFTDYNSQELFRQFDNLKTIEMLADISVAVTLDNGVEMTVGNFSDGQFQSVYIYSVLELFKDHNCVTLLDEPDSFLHPEWQSDFLKQVFEITATAAKNNHVLLSSHSVSTIMPINESNIKLFQIKGNKVTINRTSKSEIVKSLSAGRITLSETEARLSIYHVLHNAGKPVLFTEGITDELILDIAWGKLYGNKTRNFEIQHTFGCDFLRSLITNPQIYKNFPSHIFFSIFDFDEAYTAWHGFGEEIQSDPYKCLVRKHKDNESYALLLPVPSNPNISKQVINPINGKNYGNRSLLTIELLFYGTPILDKYFCEDIERPGGFKKFSNIDKEKFAKEVVPKLDKDYFKVFTPIFEFIERKIKEASKVSKIK